MKSLFATGCILFIVKAGFAHPDSSKVYVPPASFSKAKVLYISGVNVLKQDSFRFSPIDTVLAGVHHYNPVDNQRQPYRYGGYLNAPAEPFQFSPIKKPGVDPGFHAYDVYLLKADSIKFYKAGKKFTEIQYALGAKKEQYLYLTHSQNVGKGLNLGFQIQRRAMDGYLARQQTYGSGFDIFGSFISRNTKYRAFGSAIYNKIENQENGGLGSSSDFGQGGGVILAANTKLINAERDLRNLNYRLSQHYDLRSDSSHASGFYRVSHYIEYSSTYWLFKDSQEDGSFIPQGPLSETYDSTSFRSLKNSIRVQRIGSTGFFIEPYINQFWYRSNGQKLTSDGVGVSGRLSKDIAHHIFLSGDLDQSFSGYNNGDHLYTGLIQFNGRSRSLELKYSEQARSAPLVYTLYNSNSYNWNNQFAKTQVHSFTADLKIQPLSLSIEGAYSQIGHLLLFDFAALPNQYNNTFSLYQLKGANAIRWKSYTLESRIILQRSSSDVIRLSPFYVFESLYHKWKLFKNTFDIIVGADFKYFLAYYGNAYMPATEQFYLQNVQKVGNYPVVDFFIDFRIKTASLFIKVEHANKGLVPYSYYQVPDYPMQGRVLRFGFTWRFFD